MNRQPPSAMKHLLALGCLGAAFTLTAQSAPAVPDPLAGQFYGLFGKTTLHAPLASQVSGLQSLYDRNPHLKGLTIRTTWKELEPAEGGFTWEGMDKVVGFARDRKLHLTFELMAGWFTPDWVYAKGARSFDSLDPNPIRPTYGKTMKGPLPWDETYQKYWRRLVSAAAARYGNEPRLLDVAVYGHQHRLEMHMARSPDDMERWKQAGWSLELVEKDWKEWVDFFAATFPRPRITLILSPMYDRSTQPLVGELAAYAIKKYPGRIILMTHAVNGRGDLKQMLQTGICLDHPGVPNAHEFLASFREPPGGQSATGKTTVPEFMRQGSVEMTIYNMRQLSPLYVRPLDANDVELCGRLVKEYERARGLSLADYRKDLEARGLFVAAPSTPGARPSAPPSSREAPRAGSADTQPAASPPAGEILARPAGIFSVGLRRQPPSPELLAKPFVDGVTIAEGWIYAEPAEGKYDFATIEKALAAVGPPGKKLTICLFPFPVPVWLTRDPKVQTYRVPHAGPGFLTPVPWDERGLARWEALCKALAEHKVPDRAQGGKMVPLRDHPLLFAVHCWPMGMNGIRDIAMVSGRDTPLHATPNYSREALTKGILRSTRAMVDHFPRQFRCVPFFRIQDKTASPSLDQHLVTALKKEFWNGPGAPQVGLLQENLSAGGPNASGGSVLIQEKSNTYIMLQAIESWAKPTQGFAGAVRQGSPADAIQRGYQIFDSRYFEIYAADLLHPEFAEGFTKWHAVLHGKSVPPRPTATASTVAPATRGTPAASTPTDGITGRLKSVDAGQSKITVTVGDTDKVFSVANAKFLRPDGQEVAGGLTAIQGFAARQAVLATIKTEKKDGKEVVTEVQVQPAAGPGGGPPGSPARPGSQRPQLQPSPPPRPQARNAADAGALEGIQIERDVEYGQAGGVSLRLDLCRPTELPKEPMPVVIYIHGGGWKSGDKGDVLARKDPVSTGLMKGGYCLVTINYRLSGVAPFPAAVEDSKCAVRWVRANAGKYHLDPDRIGIWGTSSGGHLALMAACADEKAGLEGKGGHAGVSSRVAAACAWYPATDFTKGPGVFLSGRGQSAGPGEFIGGTLEEKPEACKQATVATHVSKDDPPTLLIHGDKDPITPFWQSETLLKKMKDAGVDATLITVKNGAHGFGPATPGGTVAPARDELFEATLEFFDKHLRPTNRR